MNRKLILVYGILLIFAVLALYSQQEVVLTIKEGVPAFPMALPTFISQDSSSQTSSVAETLHQVISADLKYSRVFNLLPKSYYSYIRPLDPKKIFFKDWESIQARFLFVGEVAEEGKENIIFEGRTYDVKAGRLIFGKRYRAEKSLLHLVAHRMSDEIMKRFGERQIFTSKIVFVSNRDGNDEIYMMDYDGRNQTRLTFNKMKDYMPAWAADGGKKVAYTSYRGDAAGLYIYDIYEGTRFKVFDRGTNFSPSFSPDGKKLAFCSTFDEGNAEIYVTDGEGKNMRRMTFNNSSDVAPSWSPTSREVAFTSDRGGTPQIYIMDAEGSNVRRISFGGNYHDGPSWSPSGNLIAYVARVDQIFDIYVQDLRTKQIIKLTESNARNESPCWSSDGRHLIFSSNRSGTIQLYSIDYDGTNLRRLTTQGENKLPDWSR